MLIFEVSDDLSDLRWMETHSHQLKTYDKTDQWRLVWRRVEFVTEEIDKAYVLLLWIFQAS